MSKWLKRLGSAIMAKRQQSSVLNRLAGKKLVFDGKFGYGVEDSLKAMAEAQQGTVHDHLDAKVDYLVLADLAASKTIQKKAASLNAKGASIQVIDADAFRALAEPTDEEIVALLKAGESERYAKIRGPMYYRLGSQTPTRTFHSEDFGGANLENTNLDDISLSGCRFVGANFTQVRIVAASDCDFSKIKADSSLFGDVRRCRFKEAQLSSAQFEGDFSDADFTGAVIKKTIFSGYGYYRRKKGTQTSVTFTKAELKGAIFNALELKSPDFTSADLTGAQFQECTLDSASFRNTTLRDAVLFGCQLSACDLTSADLTAANLGNADLRGCKLLGANLKNANLRGTNLDGLDLSKVKNYDPSAAASGSVGPALTELDSVGSQAKRIQVTFHVRASDANDGEEVQIDSSGLNYGWGIRMPPSLAVQNMLHTGQALAFSDGLLKVGNAAGHLKVCFETVDVSSTKSPKGGKELRDLVMKAIAEAFAQEIPPEEELAEATKKYREAQRERGAAQRELRAEAKAQAEKQKAKAKKQIAKKIEKAVGKVSDVASFLKALELRIEKPKIDKATKMLKVSGFKLFNDITHQFVSGVVKSQTDPDLVYACRVAEDGQYSCCTQNLNVCGGLRGSLCKHQLVLIIGLVQAGELDPTTIDGWIAKTHDVKPELDKETMGAIFIKYKGAEAGEVDWRPTETVPQDYYAL
jgi:uncharacterized protein YjbI with pentapeptide repeats